MQKALIGFGPKTRLRNSILPPFSYDFLFILRFFVLVRPTFGTDWRGLFQVIKFAAALETHVSFPKAFFIHRFPPAKMFPDI